MASKSPLPGDICDRLESVLENAEILYRQIADSKTSHLQGVLTHGLDHSKLISAAQLVSNGCTKMAILFSQSPPTAGSPGCGVLCQQLEQATLQLAAAFHHMSPHQGRSLQLEAKSNVMNILASVKKLITLLIQEGCSSDPATLRESGMVWESCEHMNKLSKDNQAAAGRVCLIQLRLLRDAWEEVQELQSGGGEGEGFEEDSHEGDIEEVSDRLKMATLEDGDMSDLRWSEADLKSITPAVTLVQTAFDFTKLTCKQVVTCGGMASPEELDNIAERVGLLSPLVDDLASELPAPIDVDKVCRLAVGLGKALVQVIDTVDSCQFAYHGNSDMRTKHFRDTVQSAISQFENIHN